MTDVRAAYDDWAGTYDIQANTTRDADAVVLAQLLPGPAELARLDVLELGCGTGKNTLRLAAARSLTALDFSEGMLTRARRKLTEARAEAPAATVTFVQHDLLQPLPFEAGGFDLVTANLVLEHLPALAPVFAEMARVLRPGGQALAIELHPFRQMAGKQANFADASGATVKVPATLHLVSEYVRAVRAAGLELVDLGEWDDVGAGHTPGLASAVLPRLLSIQARRP